MRIQRLNRFLQTRVGRPQPPTGAINADQVQNARAVPDQTMPFQQTTGSLLHSGNSHSALQTGCHGYSRCSTALKEQRTRIDRAIAALRSPARRGRPPKTSSTTTGTRRQISAAARKRISQAMRQRWAKWKGKSVPKTSTPTKTKSRPGMSAAARPTQCWFTS